MARSRRPTTASGGGIDASRVDKPRLAQLDTVEQEKMWRSEYAKAIAALNRYVEQNGLPLAKWRQF
jgi:antitoxin CcdA